MIMNDLAQLRLRVASGDESARLVLARRLIALPDKQGEAVKLLQAACDRNVPAALRLQATLAVRGVGRTQNFDEAIELVARAAAAGDAEAREQLRAIGGKFDHDAWFAPMQLQRRHTAPRVFTVEKFLPRPVCNWFIDYARRRQEMSLVRDGATGRDVLSAGRSATLAGTDALELDIVLQLTKLRIAEAIQTHVSHQEPTQFLRYGPGQEYQAHYDLIRPQEEAAAAEELRVMGQRTATVLIYLNDEYKGGETHFPHLNWGFRGKSGDALIFWNISAAGERERASLHAGLPIKTGTKWILSQWVRAKPVPLI
jgi:prolyl 4-hydroxylase